MKALWNSFPLLSNYSENSQNSEEKSQKANFSVCVYVCACVSVCVCVCTRAHSFNIFNVFPLFPTGTQQADCCKFLSSIKTTEASCALWVCFHEIRNMIIIAVMHHHKCTLSYNCTKNACKLDWILIMNKNIHPNTSTWSHPIFCLQQHVDILTCQNIGD